MPDQISITDAIARFAVETEADNMPASARHIMRLSLVDWASVAIAGRDEPVAQQVRALVENEAGKEEATVIGSQMRLPARPAALSNGATSHALDYDDTHFIYIGHASVVNVSAALALAEKTRASGTAFLDAALIGVESTCRIGDWLGRSHYRAGFHQTATSGSFGAAAASARLLGLNAEQTRHALGIVSTRASGLKSQFGTMGKPFNAGIAASNGVEAALLASAGFVSRPDGIECVQGFADTHAGTMGDPATALTDIGTRFVFESVQHKYHACCHGLHAALEAIASLRESEKIEPDAIERVVITTNPGWLKVCNIAEPATGLEAKFSYRLTAAMAFHGIDTGALETFNDGLCRNHKLVALRDRVEVETDENLTDTQSRVAITLRSGETHLAEHDLEHPLPAELREEKIRRKSAVLLGDRPSESLWEAIEDLDEGGMDAFTTWLRHNAM
ncbi:MAG: MmgE/PrpD family protein [Pseudomonadota bacterium]